MDSGDFSLPASAPAIPSAPAPSPGPRPGENPFGEPARGPAPARNLRKRLGGVFAAIAAMIAAPSALSFSRRRERLGFPNAAEGDVGSGGAVANQGCCGGSIVITVSHPALPAP